MATKTTKIHYSVDVDKIIYGDLTNDDPLGEVFGALAKILVEDSEGEER